MFYLAAVFAGRRQKRPELTASQVIERAESAAELDGTQPPLAVQPAQKILRRLFPFFRIAFQATRHQVQVGIRPPLDPRHDVVQAPHTGVEPPQAVKAQPALAGGSWVYNLSNGKHVICWSLGR
jgi:hypothetical protein